MKQFIMLAIFTLSMPLMAQPTPSTSEQTKTDENANKDIFATETQVVKPITVEDRLSEITEQTQSEAYNNELQTVLEQLSVSALPDVTVYDRTISILKQLNQRFTQQNATVEILQAVAQKIKRDHPLAARTNHDLGVALSNIGDYANALVAFENAASLAALKSDQMQNLKSLINGVNAAIEAGQSRSVKTLGQQATDVIAKLSDSAERSELQVSLAYLLAYANSKSQLGDSGRLDAYRLAQLSLRSAEANNDQRLLAYSNGVIGYLYELEKRYSESIFYTRNALLAAQRSNATELEFQWEWQLARALNASDKKDTALQAYQRAFEILTHIRQRELAQRSDAFEKTILPIYTEYLDLFTDSISRITDDVQKQQRLSQLRDAIEQLKLAEIEDYFQNTCYETDVQKQRENSIGEDTVVIHPVILKNRVELLIQRGSRFALYSAKADRSELVKRINTFRENISNYRLTDDYLTDSKYLYQVFVKPYENELTDVRTVVYVAAWMLRTIPVAALNDGKQFLIEKYALITTPSMTLTNTAIVSRAKMKILANGITQAVQGYDALPSVANELQTIAKLHQAVILKDQQFSVARAKQEIGNGEYGIVHVATHGEFESDFRRSYILGYDDKITLNALEHTVASRRYGRNPIELLVLSACQTAAGDDRAALGLAGVTIKAGARSALATLWFISDDATSQLIEQFYTGLNDPTLTKAEALRNAQISLINSGRFQHPNFWAPFILIGNWY